jgi:hypothetical protein
MLAAAIVLLYASRGQTIRGDELGYAARLASEPFPDAVLESPPNKYFIAVPLLLYDAMFNLFGLDEDVPFRIVVTALVLLCGGLFFLLARRRVGDLLALPPTVLLLLFGSGWETLITPLRIPALIALASGLGSLIVLERRDRRGDVAAMALLSAAVASHPIGLSFLVAAGVLVIARPPPARWRSAWVLAVPAAVFGAWWLFLRSPSTESFSTTRPIDVARFAIDSWTTVAAHVSGLAALLDQPTFEQTLAQVGGAALFAAIVAAVAIRRSRIPASLWAALAALVVLLASTRLSPGGFLRNPEEVRYLYPAAVLLLLVLVELAAIARPRVWAASALTAVLLLGLVYNLDQLRAGSRTARLKSQEALGDYSAYEIAGPGLDLAYTPEDFAPSARQYLQAAHGYGSVARPPAALLAAPAAERRRADTALVGSLGIGVRPVPDQPRGNAPPPRVTRDISGRAKRHRGCLLLEPRGPSGAPPAPTVPLEADPSDRLLKRALRGLPPTPSRRVTQLAQLTAPPRGITLHAADLSRTAILVGRFWEPPAAQLERPGRGRVGVLRLPDSGLALPWRIIVASNRPVTACGLGGR